MNEGAGGGVVDQALVAAWAHGTTGRIAGFSGPARLGHRGALQVEGPAHVCLGIGLGLFQGLLPTTEFNFVLCGLRQPTRLLRRVVLSGL